MSEKNRTNNVISSFNSIKRTVFMRNYADKIHLLQPNYAVIDDVGLLGRIANILCYPLILKFSHASGKQIRRVFSHSAPLLESLPHMDNISSTSPLLIESYIVGGAEISVFGHLSKENKFFFPSIDNSDFLEDIIPGVSGKITALLTEMGVAGYYCVKFNIQDHDNYFISLRKLPSANDVYLMRVV